MREQVGCYFTDEDGKIWQMISYCAQPTAEFEMVGTNVRRGGAVNSLIVSNFKLIEDSNVQQAIQSVSDQINQAKCN